MAVPSYPPSSIVDTVYGKVQGRRLVFEGDRQADAFQGIPFASPPVGELRFKKPVPPAAWEGIKETTKFGPRAIQKPMDPTDYDRNGVPSEDCLYLNVFTPAWEAPEGGFSVMVFIHGGAFIFGDAQTYGDVGICENIVSRGIVFVTIQYRVGHLGFFSTGDDVCPGNFGLWDQVEALKWIQLNIGAFGGDKHNVTLLGQSAGGASVDLLHLSPHSTNLFHKAICMAGAAECRWALHPNMPLQSIRKACRVLQGEFTGSEELMAKLRDPSIPAEQFAVGMYTQCKEDYMDFETSPCLDGDFFPASLDELRRKATPKPILTGVTKEEGILMMPGRQNTLEAMGETLKEATQDCGRKEEMKAKVLHLQKWGDYDCYSQAELLNRYVGNAKPGDEAYMRAQAALISDAMFCAGTLQLCKKAVELQTEPVFLYVFEHFHPEIMGPLAPALCLQDATHTSELFYLFKKGIFANPELTETEQRVMDTYTDICTNFAKYGDPNGVGSSSLSTPWLPVTVENLERNYVIASQGTRMDERLFEGRTAAFIDIHKKHK